MGRCERRGNSGLTARREADLDRLADAVEQAMDWEKLGL
jgi:hypothetical protein